MRGLGKLIVLISGLITVLALVVVGGAGLYFYIRLTRDLPRIDRISDYRPKAVTSIYAENGTLIAEMFEERRYPVQFDQIPDIVKKAFLAAEDASFYTHPGIDFVSILRAMVVNLRSAKTKQGASTITQQVVKSLLLSRERTFERKGKEAVLSYRLEKALTKDEIFSIYLNQIFLGSNAYGVAAAAKVHFHKNLSDLSLAEAAFIAGLPQKPSQLTKPENRQMALGRQQYVLHQMRHHGLISQEAYDKAKEEKLVLHEPEEQTIYGAPYFAAHVIRTLPELFRKMPGDMSPTNPGGFSVVTTANIDADKMAARALQRGLRELDKREGWRGPLVSVRKGAADKSAEKSAPVKASPAALEDIDPDTVYQAVVRKINAKAGLASVQLGEVQGIVDLKKAGWAKRLILSDGRETGVKPEDHLKPGDTIEVSLDEQPAAGKVQERESVAYLKLDQTPAVGGAFVCSNALTGEVKAIVGGYDYDRSQFNRATQGMYQPGSSFKPFIYLTAIERLGYTPSSLVPDAPISLPGGDGKLWTPKNFDNEYLGPITLRTALQRSRNVVSVYLIQRTGVDKVVDTARRLGITTPLPPNMSLALGTAEVRLIELVHAYGAFAAEGWLADEVIVKSIKDRDGKTIFKKTVQQKKVIEETEAFIMANMMKGVVERGTAQKVKELGRPVAGKTGTTNDQMDAWFVGYTPEWVAGVWVGFDQKKSLGRLETGGKAAAPVFVYFMRDFLEDKPVFDFNIPDGVIPVAVDLSSGVPVESSAQGAFIEYFKSGTEPSGAAAPAEAATENKNSSDYLTSDEF